MLVMDDPKAHRAGSLWRRWDLHIHAPTTRLSNHYGSSDDDWDRYIDRLEESQVQVFGITDYFTCASYVELRRRFEQRKPTSTKVLLPNIEFRLTESISDKACPNLHVIFDCSEKVVTRLPIFLQNLKTYSSDEGRRVSCAELRTTEDFESASVNLHDLLKALHDTFGTEKSYLVAFPVNNDGVRSVDGGEKRKVKLLEQIQSKTHLFFGRADSKEHMLPKPVVSGSDAHSFDDLERLDGNVANYPPTWIKSDTTFSGLLHLCHEADSRVFIGTEPSLLVRKRHEGMRILSEIRIDQIPEYGGTAGRWFKNVRIPLNPELTIIIGNKGGGKSAIADVIGLLGNSRQEDSFSFLSSKTKERRFRKRGYAENFMATAIWSSGDQVEKGLAERCSPNKAERVRYLPQNYFERLTNDIEIDRFRKEIEDVVFSHVDETDRLGTTSFSDLQEKKTAKSEAEILGRRQSLAELNKEIDKLERDLSAENQARIQGLVQSKQEELHLIGKTKPAEVNEPDSGSPEQLSLRLKHAQWSEKLESLTERERLVKASLSEEKQRLQRVVGLRQSLEAMVTDFGARITELRSEFDALGVNSDEVLALVVNLDGVSELETRLRGEVEQLEAKKLDADEGNVDSLTTRPDLESGIKFVRSRMDELSQQMSTAERVYRKYLDECNQWQAALDAVVGDSNNPPVDSLNGLLGEQKRIRDQAQNELSEKREARRAIARAILTSKKAIVDFYTEVKSRVETELESVRAEGYDVTIDASFIPSQKFSGDFLSQIDQRKKGPFRTSDSEDLFDRKVSETDWNDCESAIAFCEDLLTEMTSVSMIQEQSHDAQKLYNYLFSFDYLIPKYELGLGKKSLLDLSPGEKGLLLLVFYLQLDRERIPLVIDQPEDNLDNESIFNVLAKCIRQAKRRRQVICVTHNANLAIGADAEEVVCVKLDKAKGFKFSYESGAIENPKISSRILDILEGSQPAFVKRRLKYGIV